MKKILIITGRYLPGYKDGGPVRSIKNLTDYLGDEYDFYILTADRDHGDEVAYPNIKYDDWNQVGKAKVWYVKPKGFKRSLIKQLANKADLVYVCGCFNDYSINTLLLNRFGRIKKPVVVASMGLFSSEGFKLKYKKKKLFVTLFNIFGMFKKIYWSATSEREIEDVCREVKATKEQFFVAEDLPRIVDKTPVKKTKGNALEVVWISRIDTHKNLLGTIEILCRAKEQINFTIYGPVHLKEYWEKCKNALEKLPENVRWQYKGNVESEDVVQALKKHHVFLFTTLGENYGHVIQEALSAGCACIISDHTPWGDIEKNGVGYVFKLDEKDKFSKAIDGYAKMTEDEIQLIADRALKYAIENSNEKAKNTGYRDIFNLC